MLRRLLLRDQIAHQRQQIAFAANHHWRRTMGVAVSGSKLPESLTHPVHWPLVSSASPVDERGPSTIIHSARSRPVTPTPSQDCKGFRASGKVYEALRLWPGGGGSGWLEIGPTRPPKPMPTPRLRCSVACQVGSMVPA